MAFDGTIKKIVTAKGFGYISPAAGGDDVFFHCTKVIGGPLNFDLLQEGQAVTFNLVEGKKGEEAHNVAPLIAEPYKYKISPTKKNEIITAPPRETVEALADQGTTRLESIAEYDALNRKKITAALVRIISDRTTSDFFAISLFGHWGSGKSSQISFVSSRLSSMRDQRINLIEFNAWQHERTDNIGAALAQTIIENLLKNLTVLQQLNLAFQLSKKRQSRFSRSIASEANNLFGKIYLSAIESSIITPSVLLLSCMTILAFANIGFQTGSNLLNWMGSLGIGIGALWIGCGKIVSKNIGKIFSNSNIKTAQSKFSIPDFNAKLGSFHEIHTNLKHLCEIVSSSSSKELNQDKILLVIDDLDRCNPQTIKDVFDATRLVTNIPCITTLVAIDERIAFSAVEKHFGQFGFAGRDPSQVARDYLAKVFQVSIKLPAANKGVIDEFIQQELFLDELHESSSSNKKDPLDKNNDEISKTRDEKEKTFNKNIRLTRVLPEEVHLFSSLAEESSFSNPRELRRLKQAWAILKPMVLENGYTIETLEPWMCTLFIQEWILQASTDVRISIETSLQSGLIKSIFPNELLALRLLSVGLSEFIEFRKVVEIVLLPASPIKFVSIQN